MEQLIELGIFVAKALIIVLAILAIILTAVSAGQKSKSSEHLDVDDLNDKFDDYKAALSPYILDKKDLKKEAKALKKLAKSKEQKKSRMYVLEFNGDIQASQVDQFRDEVSALLTVADKNDKVLIRIESPGGTVHGYGLAAAQILRLKNSGLEVIAAVDKVAASGGYLMACTATKIIAAPFAILGSIGVVAQVPNIHKLLKKNDVDYEEITSGEYKRTVSLLGEITEKGRKKFTEQIEDTHKLFKDFVSHGRPQLDMEKVATGEYWFGYRAKELLLVDEIMTSDEYLFNYRKDHKLLKVSIQGKKSLVDRLHKFMGDAGSRFLLSKLSSKRFLETGI